MLSFINIINTSALSCQTSTNIGFTFLPTLNVSLSSNNLTINNLVPGGNAVDSNTITVNISTNITEGYNLYATVGSNSSNNNSDNNNNINNNANANTNTNVNNGYNTANLVNTVDNNYVFTPLSSNVSELANFTNNNWGYSYSLDSGITWISGDYDNASTGYNGLPLYTNTGIKLVEEADNTSSTVDFKIAAKASSTQPSGEYTNVINFTAVSNTIPTTMLDAFIASGAEMYNGYFKMQDMTPTICSSIDTDGEKGMQLIDVRDDKIYWVAKLADNNCWMTQNLDLDLDPAKPLTSNDTDLNDSTSAAYQDGYTVDNGIVYWTLVNAANTINFENDAVDGWQNSYAEPYSANKTDSTETGHASLGNYYNWTAAIASNNSSSLTQDTLNNVVNNPKNSICPKGWRLPTISNQSKILSGSTNEFARLNYLYNNDSATDDTGLVSVPLFLYKGGHIDNAAFAYGKPTGYMWSSTPAGVNGARYLGFYNTRIWVYGNQTDSGVSRKYGFSVRCLAR